MKSFFNSFFLAGGLLIVCHSRAADVSGAATNIPTSIELHDQYDVPQKLTFPTTNVTVLTIADKKGSEQIDGWVVELKKRYAGRIALRGIAEVDGVPGLMKGMVRKKFQKLHSYPVMMDWSGKVIAQLSYQKNVANILVIGRDGVLLGRFCGAADGTNVAAVCVLLDKSLSTPSPPNSSRESATP